MCDYSQVVTFLRIFEQLFRNVVIPDAKSIELFGDTAESFYEKILINKEENRRLAKLRDWLLPMLMNGQVEVEKGPEDKRQLLPELVTWVFTALNS